MKRLLLLFVFTLSTFILTAQKLYLDPVFNSISVTKNIQYNTNRSYNILYQSGYPNQTVNNSPYIDANLFCDFYEPQGDTSNKRPVVILLHSGDFLPKLTNRLSQGNKEDSVVIELAKRFAKRGYIVFTPNYRLGWRPTAVNELDRTETYIKAVYRGIQDVRNCIRFVNNNRVSYKADTARIIVSGIGDGGTVALTLNGVNSRAKIEGTPKFMRSDFTPMLSIDTLGDWRGLGGNPYFNTSGQVGINDNFHLVFNIGGILPDSTWLDITSKPIVSVHNNLDDNFPYDKGNKWSIPYNNRILSDVSGSFSVIRIADRLGINQRLASFNFEDTLTQIAKFRSNNLLNIFTTYSGTLSGSDASPWEFWDRSLLQNTTSTNFYQYAIPANGRLADSLSYLRTENKMTSERAYAYLDTIVNFLSLRSSKYLYELSASNAINIIPDTIVILNQDSVLLNAGGSYSSYVWSNGDTSKTTFIKNSGRYIITIDSSGIFYKDTVTVVFLNGIQQEDTTVCQGRPVNLSVPGNIPKNGIVAWYPFNGNANDESGNGYHIYTNFSNYSDNDRFNQNSKSAHFTTYDDTLSGSMDLPTGLSSTFNALYSGTITMWVKVNQHVITNHYFGWDNMFLAKQKHGENAQLDIGLLGGTRKVRFHLNGGFPASTLFYSNTELDTGKWYNITVKWDSQKQGIYINGILENEIYGSYILPNLTNPSYFKLGVGDGIGALASQSNIDNVGFWNRALTNDEIADMYYNSLAEYTNKWSTNDTTNSITVSPNTSTTYYCDFTVGSYTLRDSVRINVRNLPNKNISYTKLGLCKNDTIALNANVGYSYNWFKNDSIVSSLQTLNVAEQDAYRVVLTDSFGCKNTSDTLRVFNAPLPNVQFIINDSAQCVKDNLFQFKDSTLLDSGTYNRIWNMGSGNTSTQIEPSYNFAAVGTYPIKLQINTNYGCKDSLTKMVLINPNPVSGPMLGDNNALKTATPYVYTVAQQPNHTYNWTITNGIITAGQGTNAATVQWLSNGKGYVKVEVTNTFGCADTTSNTVNIGNVGLGELSHLNQLAVYPNPSKGSFTISFNALKSMPAQVSIINLLGQQIWSEQHVIQAGEQTLQIYTNLASGVYTLRINNHEEQVQQKIIIK